MNTLGPIDSQPMFGMQAYMVNGKMFAAAGDQGILVKLPQEVRQPLLESGQAQVMLMGSGSVFGEWVTLPAPRVSDDPNGTLALVRQSFDYVLSVAQRPRPPREERRFRKRQF